MDTSGGRFSSTYPRSETDAASRPTPTAATSEQDHDQLSQLPDTAGYSYGFRSNNGTATTLLTASSLPITPRSGYQPHFPGIPFSTLWEPAQQNGFSVYPPTPGTEAQVMTPVSPQFAFRPPTAPAATRPLSSDGTEPPTTAVSSNSVSFQAPPPTSQSEDLSSPPSSSRAQSAHRSGTQSSGLSGSSFWSSSKDTKNLNLSDPVFLAVKEVSFDGSAPAVTITEVEVPAEAPKEMAAKPELESDDPEEDSPYPEVRASVSNTDDPDMPCLTFRAVFLSLVIGLVFNAANTFFYLRYPAAYLTSPTIVLTGYLGGKALEKLLPIRSWEIAGHEFSLNPGPFNVKEHTIIFLAGGISLDTGPAPWGLAAVIVWDKMYHQKLREGFSYLFLLSAQLMGLGLAGMASSLFVQRADAIWPQNLSICAMLNTLHAGDDAEGYFIGPSRLRLFATVVPLAGLWTFLPGYLFTAVSYFSVICWIWPNKVVVNQIFGTVNGLGMSFITLDWSQIAYIGSPLTMPFWAQVHVFGAFVVFYWVLLPILYYTNVWESAHMPIMGTGGYDRFAQPYDVNRVLDLQTLRLNQTAYDDYSPLYLPISFAMTYTLAWTIPPALLMQTLLIFGPVAYRALRGRPKPGDYVTDIHAKLMKRYPAVPLWWHGAAFIVGVGLAIGAALFQPSLHIPLAAVFLAIALAIVWIIPDCYIAASTGMSVAINLLVQTIPGVLWQGEPLTNMVFKVFCIMTMSNGGVFVKGFKLGHYMKIPPKYTFFAQFAGILLGNAWQIYIKERLFAAIPDICEPNQHARLTCPQGRVFYTASIVWGLIGPTRQFGKGAIYYGPPFAAFVGATLPLLVWIWNRRYPFTFMRKFNVAVALNGPTGVPPATGINYSSWFLTGVIFRTTIGLLLCFLILQLPKAPNGFVVNWWGNTVWQNMDFSGFMTVHEARMASPPPILSSQRPQSPPIRGGDKLKNSILANSQSGWTSTTVISPLKITKQPKAPPSPDATPSPPMSSNLSSNQGSPGATTVRRTSSSFSHVRNHGLVSNSPFIRSPTLDGDGGPLGAKFRPIPQSESGGYKVLPRPSKIPGVTPRKPSPSIAMIANRRVSPAQATRRASLERRKRLMENENFQKALAMEAAAMGYTGQGLGIISSSQGLGKKPSKGLSKVAELEFVSKSPFIAGPKQSNSTNTSPSLTSSANSSPQQSQPEESEDAEEPATPTTFEHQTPDIHVEDTSDGRATPDDEESPMALSEPSKSLPNTSLGVSPHPSRPLPASPRSRRAAAAFYDSSNQAPPSPPSPARRPGPQYSTPTPVRFIISSTPTPTKSSLKSKRRIRGPRSPELDGSFVVERTPSGRRRYGSLRRRHERRKTVTFDERCDVLEFEPDSDEDFVDSEWVTSEEEDAGPYYAEEAEEEVDQHEQHSDHGDDYEHEREQGYEDEPAPRSSEVDAIHGLVNSMIEDEMNEFNADNSMEAEYDQSGDSRHTLQFKSGEEANTSLDFHEGSNASVDFAAANTSLDFQEANTSLDFHEGDSFELRLQKATQNRCVDSDDQVEAEEEEEEETPQRSRQEAQGDLTVESAHLEYLASPSGTPQRRNNHNETSNQHNSPPSESAPVADSGSQAFLLGGKGQAFASGSTLGSTGSWSSHLVQSDSQSSLSGRASPRISREDVQRRLAEHRVGKAMLGDEEGQTESEGEDVPRRHTAAALTAFARRPHGNAEDGRPLPQLPASGSAERIQAPSMNRVPQSHDAVLQTTASQNTPDRPQSLPVERSLTTDGNLPQAAYNHPPAHPSLTRTYDITQPGVDIADVKSALDRLMIGVENGFLDDGSQAGSTNSRPGSFAGPSVPTQHPPIETVRSSYVLRSSTPLSMPPEDVDSSQELIASQLPSPAPPPKEDQTLAPSRPTSLVRVKSGKEILKEHEAHVIAKRREARRRENSIHGRPLSKRRSLSTSDAEGARRERKSFVGQAVELLDVPIDEVDLPLTDSIDRELRNLNEGEQPTYRLREREETIYASADDRVSHMTRAGDVNTGRAWRVVRRASDMNEYARQIRDWRNQDRSGRAHGKVFVKVLGLRDINVPLPNQPTDFTVTLNNGIHCVETPETRLDKECRVEQEFELIEHGQLEFTLTIKVRKDPHIVAQMQAINAPRITPSPAPPPIPVAPPPKGGFLSLFGGSKKSKTHKRAYTQPETILQQPPQSRHVDECFAKYLQPDGTLGTAFISFKDVARRCDTRLFETSYPLIGYSADDKRASSGLQLGEVVLQIFRLPPLPGVKPDQLPQSLEECHRGLRHIAWHKVMYHEGTLTQSGGDCKGWRRRHIKVIGANLVSFNDVTNRPTATIELKRAIAVVDNQDPNADPTSPIGSKPDEDETYNVERSFRLIFPGNEVIAFFADTDSDKSKWLDILRALIGRIPPNPLWAELVWQRQEEILSGAQPRPSVLASVTEGTPS